MTAVQGGRPELVRFLLERGAQVNARDDRGFTALHRVAEQGDLPLVELLLDRGADPRVDALGHTPVSLAEGRGHDEVVARLRRGAPPS